MLLWLQCGHENDDTITSRNIGIFVSSRRVVPCGGGVGGVEGEERMGGVGRGEVGVEWGGEGSGGEEEWGRSAEGEGTSQFNVRTVCT